jgi:hypothetical protein
VTRWAGVIGLGMSAGCTCADRVVPSDPEGPAPHFAGWDRLTDAVARRDVDAARAEARDLTEGEAGGDEIVGAALGFLQVADADELADGLAGAALACGACHVANDVQVPAPAAWTHAQGARALTRGVVRGSPVAPPDGDPLVQAWSSGADTEGRLAAALLACTSCHPGDFPRTP